jgi:hypothetical protein
MNGPKVYSYHYNKDELGISYHHWLQQKIEKERE